MKSRTLRAARLFLASLVVVAATLMMSSSSYAATGYSAALRRYPYLTDVVGSYATINWATDQSNYNAAVRWGKVGSESCTAHYTLASRTSVTVNSVAEYQWKAMLNLVPGTQYCYRVYLGSGTSTQIDLLGSDPSPVFRTQVASGSTQPYSFAVFGDWGYVDSTGANAYQARLMSLMAGSGARFALSAGDNGYPSGNQANYGDLVQSGNALSAIFGPSFWKVPGSSIPIFPASGNHGLSNSDPNHPLILNFPQDRAVATSGGRYVKETYSGIDGTTPANYPSAWYAFDAGLARIYVLDASWADSNLGTASSVYQVDYDYHWTTTSPEYQWLQADLAAHASVLKFAVWHYPLYSDDPNNASDTYLQGTNRLEGLLKQYGVDLAFAGHSHTYQRFLASSAGLPSYVSGAGGAQPLTTLGTCTSLDAYAIKFTTSGKACGSAPVPTSADQIFHYVLVSVNGTHVTTTGINSLGQSFDPVGYNFTSGSESAAPSIPGGLTATASGGTQINLGWSASSDNTGVRGYDVYRNGALIATTDAGTRSYSDTNLIPSTSYSYTVDAFDGSGNHSSASSPASTSTAASATYTFTPIADSYVGADVSGTNFGVSGTIKADGSPDYRSYLRFNVSDISGAVTKATLQLYATSSSSTGYQVRGLTGNTWDEKQLTYANAPALGALVGSSGRFSSGKWISVDVTPLITGNGLFDLGVTTTSSSSMSFYSRDAASFWPQLVVQTGGATPTPTATFTPTATLTSTPTNTALPPTSTPTFTAAPTNTPTATATETALPTSTPTNTSLPTVTPTDTPTSTPTDVLLATDTPTDTPTSTPTDVVAPTDTPTSTPTDTVLVTDTPTSSPTDSGLPTDTPTATPTSVTVATDTPTDTPTGVVLATDTPTDTPTLVAPTATPTNTPTILPATPTPTNTPTLVPPTATPTSTSTPTPTASSPAPVFSDGFESGTLSAWTTKGGLTVESTLVHTGSFAAEGNTTNGATYAKKTLPSTYTSGYARIYFNLISYSSQVNLLRFRAPSDVSIGYLYVDTTGKLGLRNDAGATTIVSTTTVTSGWHALELHMTINGTSSTTEVWLDGVKITGLSVTTNLGTTAIAAFQIGEVQTGRTYDVIFDDVAFGTQRIGP